MKDIQSSDQFIYDAFISYRHSYPDNLIAEKLHRYLESYKTPKYLIEQGISPKINRIFRDREELPTSSNLSRDIDEALQKSRFLVVICSPRSPQSKWVNQEIRRFRELHGSDNILAVLIEGEPEESFPKPLFTLPQTQFQEGDLSDESFEVIEPLAADIRAKSLRGSFRLLKTEKLRILAPMLGCKFDDLKQRHKEQALKRWSLLAVCISLFFFIFGVFSFYQLKAVQRSEALAKVNETRALASEAQARESADREREQRKIAEENELKAKESAEKEREQRKIAEEAQRIALINEQRALSSEQEAIKQEKLALEEKRIAQEQRLLAERQKEIAIAERNQALVNQSMYLSSMSYKSVEQGDAETGILLALEALPKNMELEDRPYVPEAEEALYNALFDTSSSRTFINDGSLHKSQFSPDGKYIVSKSTGEDEKGIIGIYDGNSGKFLRQFYAHSDTINEIAFSPNGELFATSSQDSTVSIWSLPDGKPVKTFQLKDSFIRICFEQDGKSIITSSYYDDTQWWDISSGRIIKTLEGSAPNSSLALGEEIRYIIKDDTEKGEAYSEVNTSVIDLKSQEVIGTVHREMDYIGYYDLMISPNGKYMAAYSYLFSKIGLWNLETGNFISVDRNAGGIRSLLFNKDSTNILVASGNGSFIFDTKSGEVLTSFDGHNGIVFEASYSMDEAHVLTCSEDGTVRSWNASTGKLERTFIGSGGTVYTSMFSPDGENIIGSSEKMNYLWNFNGNPDKKRYVLPWKMENVGDLLLIYDNKMLIRTWNELYISDLGQIENSKLLGKHKGYIWDVNCSADGKFALSVGNDIAIVWDLAAGKKVMELEWKEDNLSRGLISPDNEKILLQTLDGTLHVWDIKGKKELMFKETGSRIRSAFFSPDSKRVAYSADKAEILDCENGRTFQALEGRDLAEGQVCYSPDGNYIGMSFKDDSFGLWDAASGKLLELFKSNGVNAHDSFGSYEGLICFSPDSRYLIRANSLAQILVIDTWQKKLVKVLKDHTNLIESIDFNTSGSKMVTCSWDGCVYVWDMQTFKKISSLKGHMEDGMPYPSKPNGVYASFSKDGSSIIAWSDELVYKYKTFTNSQDLINYTSELVDKKLSNKQREQFFLNADKDEDIITNSAIEVLSAEEEGIFRLKLGHIDQGLAKLTEVRNMIDKRLKILQESNSNEKEVIALIKRFHEERLKVDTNIAYFSLSNKRKVEAEKALNNIKEQYFSAPSEGIQLNDFSRNMESNLLVGNIFLSLGDLDPAKAIFNKCLNSAKFSYDEGSVYRYIALAMLKSGDIQSAIKYSDESISNLKWSFNGYQEILVGSTADRMLIELYNKNPQKAVGFGETALKLVQEKVKLKNDNPTLIYVKLNLAHAYLFNGDYEKAKALYLEIRDMKIWAHIITKFKNVGYRIEDLASLAALDTLEDLEAAGVTHPDVDKIKILLGSGYNYYKQ